MVGDVGDAHQELSVEEVCKAFHVNLQCRGAQPVQPCARSHKVYCSQILLRMNCALTRKPSLISVLPPLDSACRQSESVIRFTRENQTMNQISKQLLNRWQSVQQTFNASTPSKPLPKLSGSEKCPHTPGCKAAQQSTRPFVGKGSTLGHRPEVSPAADSSMS